MTNPWAAPDEHPFWVLAIFITVYLGMILGGLPRLKLNRTGVALLGAIAVVGLGAVSLEEAARAVDLPTVVLLFSFMVVSAQMRLGGFYAATTRWIARLSLGPAGLLGAMLAAAAALSAVFSNDIICLAMAPVVAEVCLRRRLPPLPFLIGLACAANIGSAATLIGNPQNMLIGSVLKLPFAAYSAAAVGPVLVGLLLLWAWLAWSLRRPAPQSDPIPDPGARTVYAASEEPAFDAWQTAKGLGVSLALMAAFLFTDWPREVLALVGAGLLLLNERFHSSDVMGLVDWELLLLFMGLFVVNHALAQTGLATQGVTALAAAGIRLADPSVLFAAGVALSNLVSNVPAVMLLLPHVQGLRAGVDLALVSTLAGNLLLVGSIANLIVADLALKQGIRIGWQDHARLAMPAAVLSLAVVALWPR